MITQIIQNIVAKDNIMIFFRHQIIHKEHSQNYHTINITEASDQVVLKYISLDNKKLSIQFITSVKTSDIINYRFLNVLKLSHAFH